jgi:septum site-determining protein MinD
MNALMVATPDPAGVRDARIVSDRLKDMALPNMRLLLGRVNPSRIFEGIVPDLDFCIDNIGLQLIGVIPEDDEIAVASAMGVPLEDRTLAKSVFSNIAERLYGNDVPLAVQ